MPKLTILMAVYNGFPYLPFAVKSICEQTLQDWKFIIVNDGSTDGTAQYLEQIDDSRFQIIHTDNQGLGAALNCGLELCETELVARMDSDDQSHRSRLKTQLDYMESHPEVGLLGTQIEEMGSARVGRASTLATDHKSLYTDLLKGKAAICHPTIMCRTQVMKDIGGYWTARLGEEWDLFLRMGEQAELANLDQVLLSYRIHSSSMCGSQLANMRNHVGYACECANRRKRRLPPISFQEYLNSKQEVSMLRRSTLALDIYARNQYRIARGEMLGAARTRGCFRLLLSAACSPVLTVQRIKRVVCRKWLPCDIPAMVLRNSRN